MPASSPRWRQTATMLGLVALAILAADGLLHAVMAQVTPFGGPRPPADPQPYPASGIIGWILAKQSEFYRAMSSTIRAAKTDGSAVITLLGISFAYGVFHAAGPGHGKAVISSYMLANEETAKRGIVLSFASALLQALVAVLIVTIGALILGATARTLCTTERMIEIASYGLIAALGAWLVFTKGRGLFRSSGATPADAHAHDHGHHDHAHHDHGHHHHGHDHHGHHHDHAHHHNPAHGEAGHVHDEHCGHNHGPSPSELAGPGGWARGIGAIFAVGLRPCSGAILVLVFALAQGLFWAGVAATFVMGLGTALTVATIALIAVSAKGLARRLTAHQAGKGALVLKGIEFAAAVGVLFLGTGLLLGYLAAERTVCF
jgi:ABC-type nickel/cobalt efflux system permease component RcnA